MLSHHKTQTTFIAVKTVTDSAVLALETEPLAPTAICGTRAKIKILMKKKLRHRHSRGRRVLLTTRCSIRVKHHGAQQPNSNPEETITRKRHLASETCRTKVEDQCLNSKIIKMILCQLQAPKSIHHLKISKTKKIINGRMSKVLFHGSHKLKPSTL